MAKYFIDIVQDSPRTSLAMPVKTKKPLSRTILPLAGPPFRFKLHERLIPVSSRDRLFRHPLTRDPSLGLCGRRASQESTKIPL